MVLIKQEGNSPVIWGSYFLLKHTHSPSLKAMFMVARDPLVVACTPSSAATVTFPLMAVVWKKGKISMRFLTFVPYVLPLTLWLKTGFPEVTELPDISVLNSLKMDLKTKVFSLTYFNCWLWIAGGGNIRNKCFLFLCRNAFYKESSFQSHIVYIMYTLCTLTFLKWVILIF